MESSRRISSGISVTLRCLPGDNVFIKALECSGLVAEVSVTRGPIFSYRAIYFTNGEQKSAWLWKEEFTVQPSEEVNH